MNELTLKTFIDNEIQDDVSFEEILERFDLTPGEVFVILFDSGHIDEEILEAYLLDIN